VLKTDESIETIAFGGTILYGQDLGLTADEHIE